MPGAYLCPQHTKVRRIKPRLFMAIIHDVTLKHGRFSTVKVLFPALSIYWYFVRSLGKKETLEEESLLTTG